jgi:hypothetical protein
LNDEIHAPDIDSQLEGGRRHEGLQLALLEALFSLEALLARQAAVVTGDILGANPLRELHREALGETPSVHEHERRPMLRDQLGNPGVELFPDLRGHHRLERGRRDLQLEIERPDVARVHDSR